MRFAHFAVAFLLLLGSVALFSVGMKHASAQIEASREGFEIQGKSTASSTSSATVRSPDAQFGPQKTGGHWRAGH